MQTRMTRTVILVTTSVVVSIALYFAGRLLGLRGALLGGIAAGLSPALTLCLIGLYRKQKEGS
jgi:F0F1-type ATP synthase assembly protein I